MGACTIVPRSTTPRRRPTQQGFTTVETLLTLAIGGVLAAAGLALLDLQRPDLSIARQEMQGCLEQAFIQARAQSANITLSPNRAAKGPGIIPVQLPRRVQWGKPARIPLPVDMEDPIRADTSGEAHPTITVTPRRTATASAWFLNDGKDALCFRLSGHGRLTVLRYRAASRRWEKAG